jgi:hypothetical protein
MYGTDAYKLVDKTDEVFLPWLMLGVGLCKADPLSSPTDNKFGLLRLKARPDGKLSVTWVILLGRFVYLISQIKAYLAILASSWNLASVAESFNFVIMKSRAAFGVEFPRSVYISCMWPVWCKQT